jgi:hypothetical protein
MDEEKAPRFVIQGLPTASSNINKKYFSGDNAVSVLLGSFPLNADFFDVPSLQDSSRSSSQRTPWPHRIF